MTNSDFQTSYKGTGYIIVRASTASSAIPLENVSVILRGIEEENSNITLSLLTDRDGLTARIPLPAPIASMSEAPGNTRPYALYSIEVHNEGYYPQYYQNVPIFDGITAVQPAALVPVSEEGSKNPYTQDEQLFGQYFTESQNPNL